MRLLLADWRKRRAGLLLADWRKRRAGLLLADWRQRRALSSNGTEPSQHSPKSNHINRSAWF